MVKLIIILALIAYILSKVGGFLFRVGAASQNRNFQQRRPEANNNNSSKKEKKGNIKGGDYVDYEEVK